MYDKDLLKFIDAYKSLNENDDKNNLTDFCQDVLNYLSDRPFKDDGDDFCIGMDSRVFCNGNYYEYDQELKSFKLAGQAEPIEYCEYSNGDLTIHDEGTLSDLISMGGETYSHLQQIAKKYGYYFERETTWSVGAYKL